ncbi:MAG: DUF2127 domain-containing protein [Candidatus Sulfotelmatobacter sp.]
MGMKRSGWITGAVVLQLLYTLMMLALPVYLLVLTRASETRSGPDAQASIAGLKIAAAVLLGPALVALAGWIGLWKEKLWGWWLTVLTDLGLVALLVYSMMDDGWHNIEWDVVVLSVIPLVLVIHLLLPKVRRFYWKGRVPVAPANCIGPFG